MKKVYNFNRREDFSLHVYLIQSKVNVMKAIAVNHRNLRYQSSFFLIENNSDVERVEIGSLLLHF